jgi:hypothetical protein
MRTFRHDPKRCKLFASGARFAACVGMAIREQIGDAIGGLWAPFVHSLAQLRGARMFHPEGQLFSGALQPIAGSPYAATAQQLGRTVLARCSGALRRGGGESLDVLGIALRMHRGHKLAVHAVPTDQDLLFATIRSPFTMPLSPFTTHSHDFFANRYYAVAPFELEGLHRVELRLDPIDRSPRVGSRATKLDAAVAADKAHFELSARRTLTRTWHPIALISLTAPSTLDQTELRFDPYQCGAGIVPVGLVNAIRKRVYAASQAARPSLDHHHLGRPGGGMVAAGAGEVGVLAR